MSTLLNTLKDGGMRNTTEIQPCIEHPEKEQTRSDTKKQ